MPFNLDLLHPVEDMDPLEQMMREIEAHTEADLGWDARPEFYALGRNRTGLSAITMELPSNIYEDPAKTLPLFVKWLSGNLMTGYKSIDSLTQALVGSPEVVSIVVNNLVPSDFYGVAFFCEGWTLPPEVIPENEHLFRAHVVSEHPDRIECRMGLAVTIDGRIFMIERHRGGIPQIMDNLQQDGLAGSFGTVPDALRLMCDLFEKTIKAGSSES